MVPNKTLVALFCAALLPAWLHCARSVPRENTLLYADLLRLATANASSATAAGGPGGGSQSKQVFLTATPNNGNLAGPTGGDSLCGLDGNYPGSGTYKAMVVDGVTRIACTSANCGGGTGEHSDWVLAAATTYYRSDNTTEIFATDANGIFDFSGTLTNSFDTGGTRYWTGLNTDWTTSADDCGDWAGTGGNGEEGVPTATDATAINDASAQGCTAARRLVCVEQ